MGSVSFFASHGQPAEKNAGGTARDRFANFEMAVEKSLRESAEVLRHDSSCYPEYKKNKRPFSLSLRVAHRRRPAISPHGGYEIVLNFAATGGNPPLSLSTFPQSLATPAIRQTDTLGNCSMRCSTSCIPAVVLLLQSRSPPSVVLRKLTGRRRQKR